MQISHRQSANIPPWGFLSTPPYTAHNSIMRCPATNLFPFCMTFSMFHVFEFAVWRLHDNLRPKRLFGYQRHTESVKSTAIAPKHQFVHIHCQITFTCKLCRFVLFLPVTCFWFTPPNLWGTYSVASLAVWLSRRTRTIHENVNFLGLFAYLCNFYSNTSCFWRVSCMIDWHRKQANLLWWKTRIEPSDEGWR